MSRLKESIQNTIKALALKTHIEDLNTQGQKKADENGGMYFPLTTDIQHWNSSGVHSIEDLENYFGACVERERQKGNLINF